MSKTNSSVEEKDKALVVRETGALAVLPEYLRSQIGNHEGSEDVGQDDVLIPRLSIAQEGMTPQMKKHNENFNPDLNGGDLFDSVTNEIYGTSVIVVPLFFFKNWIDFVPMDQGGGVNAMYDQSNPPKPTDLAWVDGKPPKVQEFKNRMTLLVRPNMKPRPIVVSFKSTGIKAAKTWNSLIMDTNLPAYAYAYKLETRLKTKGQQSWYVLNVTRLEAVPEEFFLQAKAYFEQLRTAGYKVDTTGIEQETKVSDDGAAF